MPRRLLSRFQPESIFEFREAARRRYDEGLSLAGSGLRTAAIYLWGYVAEMTLKAAYFSLIGHSETATITWPGHIRPAIDRGRASPFHIQWPNHEAGHNVRAWAELLIVERAQMPGAAYSTPFALQVQSCGQEIWDLWRVTLRYHKNRAYPFEVRQVREATTWLLTNSSQL